MEWVADRPNVSMKLSARACMKNREMIVNAVECETRLNIMMKCPAAEEVKQVVKRILDERGNAVGSVLSKLPLEHISQGWRDVFGWPDLWCAVRG